MVINEPYQRLTSRIQAEEGLQAVPEIVDSELVVQAAVRFTLRELSRVVGNGTLCHYSAHYRYLQLSVDRSRKYD